jgi:hypothetical protein
LTLEDLYQELNYVDHTREKRLFYANLVIDNPDLIPKLLDIYFMVHDKISCRAAWVIEYVVRKDIELLLPYIDDYTSKIDTLHLDSSIRPAAKICEVLVSAFYGKKDSEVKHMLKPQHLEKIAETCFDWLIQKQKVAVKAHSMLALFLLGNQFEWIHPELKLTLEKDFNSESAAYKARARHILKKISKTHR